MHIDDRKRICLGWLIKAILIGMLQVWPSGATADAQTAASANPASSSEQTVATDSPLKTKTEAAGPLDEFQRGTPRSTIEGFITQTQDGQFETALNYLDLGAQSSDSPNSRGVKLAGQLKVILDRSVAIDPSMVSADPMGTQQDGLNPALELVGQIKTPEKTVDIFLKRQTRDDGVLIWKFSKQTIAEIPHLNAHFGYRPFEKTLSQFFPDHVILGWQLWQYAVFFIGVTIAYLPAYLLSQVVHWIVKRSDREVGRQMEALGVGPVRILLWFFLVDRVLVYIGPSVTIRAILRQDMLGIIAVTWAASRVVELFYRLWIKRLENRGQTSAIPLLKPAKTLLNIALIVMAMLIWLDNLGFNVGTLLAGLGVGGIAFALAAQDTIKNLLGSIMVLLDKPYRVGQRVIVKGHDGVVVEIGLRSTKLRLLSGHQTTVPNEQMANTDIENVSRRPHIRRLFNIAIRYDTSVEKIEQAVSIIEGILDNHEGIRFALPSRAVYAESSL